MLLVITCLPLGIKNVLMADPSAVFDTRKCHFSLSRLPLFPLPGSTGEVALASAVPLRDMVWRVSTPSQALRTQHLFSCCLHPPPILSLFLTLLSVIVWSHRSRHAGQTTHTHPAVWSGRFQAVKYSWVCVQERVNMIEKKTNLPWNLQINIPGHTKKLKDLANLHEKKKNNPRKKPCCKQY